MTLKVLYLTGHPAEAQLSAPIIRRMETDPYFDVCTYDVIGNLPKGNEWLMFPDVVVSPCDRVEMVIPTFEVFKSNTPIVRIFGGLRGSGTHDDVVRHMLDCMGHIHLVESEEAKQNLIRFGEEEWRVHVVGITHLDDVKLEYESSLQETNYALFLMNPVTISQVETEVETANALAKVKRYIEERDGFVVFLPPNGDKYSEQIADMIRAFADGEGVRRSIMYSARIRRPLFLGMLQECQLFISNSSSTVYEAPALSVEEIFNPSWRNAERTKPPALLPGGSDRVIEVLKSIDWSDKERILRKRFRY